MKILVIIIALFLPVLAHAQSAKKCYAQPHHLSKLTDELFSAFPAWVTIDARGENVTDVHISGDGVTVCILYPLTTDQRTLDDLVVAHDSTPPAKIPNRDEALVTDINKAVDLDAVKSAIVEWATP